MFDVFSASLRCPACGAQEPEAEIQTGIRDGSADGSALGVGDMIDPVDLEPDSIVDNGYLLVSLPTGDGPIRLLDVWICRSCQTEQWAIVEIGDCRIDSIEAVVLQRSTLERVNYIAEVNAELVAEALLDGDSAGGHTVVDILRRRLP